MLLSGAFLFRKGNILTTLRHQIGQMLIMGFAGTTIDKHAPVAEWLSGDGLGGVLLFDYDLHKKTQGKNLVNPAQIKQLTSQIRHYATMSPFSQGDLVPLIAIDYEGGAVDRLRYVDDCMVTKKAHELATLAESAFQTEVTKMAEMLAQLGFNLNFAPVVDLNLNSKQGIIGSLGRSFSADPKRVAKAAQKFVEIFNEHGITCCYKHFPGHGSATGDSHFGFVDVSETFQASEMEPYELLIGNHNLTAMIMTAHVINRNLDQSGLPATLSRTMLTGTLRQKLGFEGVIISDDLQMQAIAKHYSLDDALRLTINAGADMLIFANQLGEITAKEVIDRIEALVRAGIIEVSYIEQAYQRIIALKQRQIVLF